VLRSSVSLRSQAATWFESEVKGVLDKVEQRSIDKIRYLL